MWWQMPFKCGMHQTEQDFSQEAFAGSVTTGEIPMEFPLGHKTLQQEQQTDAKLQAQLTNSCEKHLCEKMKFQHSDEWCKLTPVTRDGKIAIPTTSQKQATEWHHKLAPF